MKVTTLLLLSALAGVATAARLRSQRLGERLGDTGPEAPPCNCIPCGQSVHGFDTGTCGAASATCSATAPGPGCYTDNYDGCNCVTRKGVSSAPAATPTTTTMAAGGGSDMSTTASTSKATTASIAAANAANDARTATEEASETSEVSIYRGMDMGVVCASIAAWTRVLS